MLMVWSRWASATRDASARPSQSRCRFAQRERECGRDEPDPAVSAELDPTADGRVRVDARGAVVEVPDVVVSH